MATNRSAQPPVARFGLIRHAATLWNVEKRIQGRQDSALTRQGEMNAKRWGEVLKSLAWDRILSSDTGRALRTAQRVNTGLDLPMETDAGLREQDWGQWTGMTVSHVDALFARMPKGQNGVGWGFCPPGGESCGQMWERGNRALGEAAERWPGAAILVVSHNGMIRCLVNRCLGLKYLTTESRVMRPNHLHLFTWQNGCLNIEGVNALDLTKERG